MSEVEDLTIGLAPALIIEESVSFGPLMLTPVGHSTDSALSEVAARFAAERGASPVGQAIVTCQADVRPLVPTIWPLFVFSCVTYARRRLPWMRGVPHPENFHVLPITVSEYGFSFDSGHSHGIGNAEHLPLRWPVDWPATLRRKQWDRRIELACTLLARHPAAGAESAMAVAAGMAADLSCAALERRNQKVQSAATGASTYVLLGAALEALHCCGSDVRHGYDDLIKGVSRLNPGHTSLGEAVFSKAGQSRPPRPQSGTVVTRPMFAAAHLVHLRNTFAHGRAPTGAEFTLPVELNGCHPMHAATLILAALIGDDLCKDQNCVFQPETRAMFEASHRLGLPIEFVLDAQLDGENLLRSLAEALIPSSGG